MAKTESTFKNMVLSLTLISLGASACLGFVYQMTKEPIELSILNKKLEAIKQVVPEFNNNPNEEMYKLPTGEGDSLDIYPAKKDSDTCRICSKYIYKKRIQRKYQSDGRF